MNIDSVKLISLIKNIAKQELLPRYSKIGHSHKMDGSIVTEADIVLQQKITAALNQHWPDFPLIGEEMTLEEQKNPLQSDKPVWCLDPLDGTTNFASSVPYFAISLSLIYENEVILGLVYDPMRNECFFAEKTENNTILSVLNDKPLARIPQSISLADSVAIVDFKRLSNELASRIVTERPFASQRNFGASALDWCWLAVGRGHIYLHGNQNLWDYSAGEFIFRSMGGYSQTFEGEAVFLKAIEKRSIIAAVNKTLFEDWLNWINESNKL